MRHYSRKQKRPNKKRKTRSRPIKRIYKGGANTPTFHVLIATGGKPQLKEMLNSLKNELLEGDAITIVFDGPDALTKSTFSSDWISGFKCPIKQIEEPTTLGFWGHAARNKHQGQLTPRTTYIMNADDDDTYIAESFKSLRSKCTDPNTLYISKMTYVSNRALNIPRQNKNIVYGDISTQNGIIPFDMAAKGVWKPKYGGDFDYYSDLNKLNPTIVFLDDVIYLKGDSTYLKGGAEGKVYVFYHVFCNSHTLAIVKDQCLRIIFSNLYKRADAVYCFLVGEQAKIDEVEGLIKNLGKKFIVAAKGPGDTTYERFTLLKIPKYIKPEDKILYIHSKGVSKPNGINEDDVFWWRTWLEYGLMTKHEECLQKLNEFDVVGVNYSEKIIGKHFSGNFWWATGKYYLSLPNEISNGGPNGYNEPEKYILTGPNVKYTDIEAGRLPENDGLYGMKFYPSKYVDYNAGP